MSKDDFLEQTGVVPYRRGGAGVEFCLITSIGKGRWGFPKGIIDPGETAESMALTEALEEAGLTGTLEGRPLGEYRYRKWDRQLHVTVFLMRVTEARDEWDEADVRQRRWAQLAEARQLLDREELRQLLDAAAERLGA